MSHRAAAWTASGITHQPRTTRYRLPGWTKTRARGSVPDATNTGSPCARAVRNTKRDPGRQLPSCPSGKSTTTAQRVTVHIVRW
jgi:hypothetical protein